MKIMKPFISLHWSLLLTCSMVTDTQADHHYNATVSSPGPNADNATRYVILDNDWGSTAFLPFLIALDADMEVLALASNTCNSWARQTSLHALALLEVGGFDRCVPVVQGSAYPLVQTEKRVQLWQQLWGDLDWQGVFAPKPSQPVVGQDPTGGDPSQISKSAFIEGFPNTTVLPDSAAHYMIEQVHKRPGKVSIYSAVSLTILSLYLSFHSSLLGGFDEHRSCNPPRQLICEHGQGAHHHGWIC